MVAKQWANVHRLKHDGIPIIGFTWYSLQHQVDWDSALRNDAGNVNGLDWVGLNRNIMLWGMRLQAAYRALERYTWTKNRLGWYLITGKENDVKNKGRKNAAFL